MAIEDDIFPTGERKAFSKKTIVIGAIIIVCAALYTFNYVRNARIEASTVVARVNGEPIYESEVNAGFSDDAFDSTTDDMKNNKVAKLIAQVAIKQFLAKNGVKVSEDRIDQQVKELEKNPPSMGCPCCTYSSLSAYLDAVGYTRENLRQDIRNQLGLNDYAKVSWRKKYPTKADVLKEIGSESKYIKAHYINAWQIFFNTFQQPGYNTNPDQINKMASMKAQKAWNSLQQGKSFDAVAKSVSQDMTSNRKGGSLGAIDRNAYGQEFESAVEKLKPGVYSKPIHTSWGYHIIKWQPMSDDDIVKFCESYFINQEYSNINSQIMKNAKVEQVKTQGNAS